MDVLMARVPAANRPPFSFRDVVHFNPGTGLWMVAVSGVLGIVFAAFVLLRKPKAGAFTEVPGRQWLQPVPPPPPVRPTVADTPPAGSAE